jgi:uncharacterized protein YfdQ (DUF2303 family)
MTDFTELAQSHGDAAVIAELADEARARDLVTLVDGRRVGVILADGQSLEEIDLDDYAATPARKTGKVTLTDADGFVTYVDRHSLERATTLWGDLDQARIVAVLDDHAAHLDVDTEGAPGWGGHRATLQLKATKDWLHWTRGDGKYFAQKDFAEHIEDGVDAIHDPDPATMLEVAQTFHAKSGVNFISSQQLSGEVEFTFEETVKAKAGQKGTLDVPQRFTLGLAPFEGCDAYKVEARFRFRLVNGELTLGYRLIRPDRALKTAFDDVVQKVAAASGLPVMAGTPRSA